jgi:hypothetical protein
MTLSNKDKMNNMLSRLENMSGKEILDRMKSTGFNPDSPNPNSRYYQIIENNILGVKMYDPDIATHRFKYETSFVQQPIIVTSEEACNDYADAA